MPERSRRIDPRFVAHESFPRLSPDLRSLKAFYAMEEMEAREQNNIIGLVETFLHPDAYVELVTREGGYTRGECRTVAAVEAAALITENPYLFYITRSFPSLYRLLRFAELHANAARGGSILLIGSGVTMDEFMAANITPPSKVTIENLFTLHNTLIDSLRSSLRRNLQGNYPQHPSIKEGKTVAIEPDLEQLSKCSRANVYFGILPSELDMYAITLGEAFGSNVIPDHLDTIIWHRVDPAILLPPQQGGKSPLRYEGKVKRERARNIETTIGALISRLTSGGMFVLTIGTGNDRLELLDRERLIRDVRNLLAKDLSVKLVDVPAIFKDGIATSEDKAFFSDHLYGAIGCAIAVKK